MSEPRSVALLELLAAAAGARVVAADAGVRVGSDTGSNRRRLGGDGRIATHETIDRRLARDHGRGATGGPFDQPGSGTRRDRKSTRLNSSHGYISYAVFCLKKKKKKSSSTSRSTVR